MCGTCGVREKAPKQSRCHECRREHERARYASDPEFRADKMRRANAAYAADPERIKAATSAYAARPENRAKERERGLRRYRAFRDMWIAELGGKCVQCGATEDLHFDHVDWREKSFNVSLRWNHRGVDEEMRKCQLLCATCHYRKSVGDRRSQRQLGKGSYGTSSASS